MNNIEKTIKSHLGQTDSFKNAGALSRGFYNAVNYFSKPQIELEEISNQKTDFNIQKTQPTTALISHDKVKGCTIEIATTNGMMRTFRMRVKEGGQDVTDYLTPDKQKLVGGTIRTLICNNVNELSRNHKSQYKISGNTIQCTTDPNVKPVAFSKNEFTNVIGGTIKTSLGESESYKNSGFLSKGFYSALNYVSNPEVVLEEIQGRMVSEDF